MGKYESLFKTKDNSSLIQRKPKIKNTESDSLLYETKKNCIRKLCFDYKSGVIDSLRFNEQLERILKGP